ncbi:class I SAM-dependent methyltransferase [Streptomyces sp. NPDC058295]|uniref:class I SAM-dependent methyltransferase n=1 Tax=Streptomyces sp. NPDC058295 TaxID=3346431 RepID=UPI0036E16018
MTYPVTTAVPPSVSGERRSAQYDAFHTARTHTDLVSRLYAEAMGEDYPAEVAASSSCDWPLLGLMTVRLRMPPDRLLVDAGCGTGGIGLWLARALAVRLAGFDLSPVAVTQATGRRADFLGTGTNRAAFRVADLEDTGLPDSSAHGIVCVDALGRAHDRDAALRELGRVLTPGGRLVLTRASRQAIAPAWEGQARAAGLTVEHVDERPAEPATWDRLYRLWIGHSAELRRELGEVAAQNMLREAHQVLPTLPDRRAVLLTLRRTVNVPAGAGGADTMCGLARRPGDGPASSERTPS